MLKGFLLLVLLGYAYGHQELSNLLLQQQKDLDLSAAEVEALRPFYQELQQQHDYLYNQQLQQSDGSVKLEYIEVDAGYAQAFKEFRAQFADYIKEKPSIKYDIRLPTLEELIGQPSANMTEQERLEFEDVQAILQDVLDEAELGLSQLVRRAIDIESNLLAFNKPKFVMAVIRGLEFMWNAWGQASRAAYCSYSHVPEFTLAIHAVNGGIDCYKHTKNIILTIENETVASVKEIKQHVQRLIKIYKKIKAKRTIFGKILSGTLNVFSVLRRVHDIIAVGLAGYDKFNNQLPGAALHTAQCGTDFVQSIPHMVETAKNLTVCITFVDTDKPEYEFTKPETKRYWNTGEQPAQVPYENDVEVHIVNSMADNDDDDDDDYVDHR